MLVLHVVQRDRLLLAALRCVYKLGLRDGPAFPPELEPLIQLDRAATQHNQEQFHTQWRAVSSTISADERFQVIGAAASTCDVLGSAYHGGGALGVFDIANRALRSEIASWVSSLPNTVVRTRVHQLEPRYFLVLSDLFSETANHGLGRVVSDMLRQLL